MYVCMYVCVYIYIYIYMQVDPHYVIASRISFSFTEVPFEVLTAV